MNLKSIYQSMFVLALMLLVSCSDSSLDEKSKAEDIPVQDSVVTELQEKVEEVNENPTDPLLFAAMIAAKIEEDNFDMWNKFSQSEIFFSPYAYIDTNTLVFVKSNNLSEIFSSERIFLWGFQNGTGDSLELTFQQYEKRYINDFKLTDTNAIENSIVMEPNAHGNELHNAHKLYPEAVLVELHKPANDEMAMNWRSLIFVIQKQEGELKLLGLVHNEWTI